jgi:hypothetical protein
MSVSIWQCRHDRVITTVSCQRWQDELPGPKYSHSTYKTSIIQLLSSNTRDVCKRMEKKKQKENTLQHAFAKVIMTPDMQKKSTRKTTGLSVQSRDASEQRYVVASRRQDEEVVGKV